MNGISPMIKYDHSNTNNSDSDNDIPAPQAPPQRRTAYLFPSYRYIPGRHPHPFRHPQGHQLTHQSFCAAEGADWERQAFLFAADLFDHCFWWEAHELWGHCWLRAKGQQKQCIQGLIQLSASLLKHHMGHIRARDRLFTRAKEKLHDSEAIGWTLKKTLQQSEQFFYGGDAPNLDAFFFKSDKSEHHEI